MNTRMAILLALAATTALAQDIATNAVPAEAAAKPPSSADAGWTPLCLQFGWPNEDFDHVPKSNIYGLGFGLFSIAANDVCGAELSMGIPVAGGNVNGVQAGLLGSVAKETHGLQVGGVFAGSKQMDGVLLAGVFAAADQLEGLALAGLFAAASGDGVVASLGLTCSGNAFALGNAPEESFSGVQIAGIANFANEINGLQLALGFNVADELHGVQIGLFNRAYMGRGVQIGFLNRFGKGDAMRVLPFFNAQF